jgi:exodeoxyribonuclease VIII
MSEHVMLHIETLGKGNYACVTSLSAVKFDPNDRTEWGGEPLKPSKEMDKFYVDIDLESAQKIGLRIDASTVLRWMAPEREAARQALILGERVDIRSALDGFSQWYGPHPLPTWGNGAAFDNVIVRNAFELLDMDCPWKFWDDRCYRTMKACFSASRPPNIGSLQTALDNTVWQAQYLQNIVARLGVKL